MSNFVDRENYILISDTEQQNQITLVEVTTGNLISDTPGEIVYVAPATYERFGVVKPLRGGGLLVEDGVLRVDPEWVTEFAPGFGEVTASIGEGYGKPTVVVTTSGDNRAKNFDFAFDGLKGNEGNGVYKVVAGDVVPTPQTTNIPVGQVVTGSLSVKAGDQLLYTDGEHSYLYFVMGLQGATAKVSFTMDLKGQAGKEPETFIYEQVLASNEWVITHTLNKSRPSVTVVDSTEEMVDGVEVTYMDNKTIKLRFSAAFTGKAFLN